MVAYSRSEAIPNGIVFINDPKANVVIPENTGAGPILSTRNCVSVWTLHEIDGSVEVAISNEPPSTQMISAFKGPIDVENGRLAINSAYVEEIVGINVPNGRLGIQVYVDALSQPESIFCYVASETAT